MRGLSEQQRDVLRLALAVNIHTQGGTAKVKGGSPVKGYRVPTVDYAGPKDLRPPLLLWALGGARLSADVAGFFKHGASSKVAKASLARAVARLVKRGMLMYAPLPKWVYGSTLPDWGYVLTQAGMDAAGAEPLDVPLLAEACELFGITHRLRN